jgi:hypothetical protein
MKTLKETFRKNGLLYQLIKRNEVVALYGIGGTYTDKILHYEVCKIHLRKVHTINGIVIPESESLPSNEEFGRDKSRATVGYGDAMETFDQLTRRIKTGQGGKIGVNIGVLTHLAIPRPLTHGVK